MKLNDLIDTLRKLRASQGGGDVEVFIDIPDWDMYANSFSVEGKSYVGNTDRDIPRVFIVVDIDQ